MSSFFVFVTIRG